MRAAASIIVAATLLLYLPTLGFRFLALYDDDRTVLSGTEIHDLSREGAGKLALLFDPRVDRRTRGLSAEYLPVRDLSFAWDLFFWGDPPAEGQPWRLNPVGYRLGNLLLYALSGLLFWAVLRRMAVPVSAALIGALFWVLHPLHVENVVWISSRKDVLSGVFFLAAILAHLRAGDLARRGGADPRTVAAVALRLASLLLGLLAMLSKATTVVLLPCLVLLDMVRKVQSQAPGPQGHRVRRALAAYGGHAAVLAIALSLHLMVLSHGIGSRPYVQSSEQGFLGRALQMAPVAWHYLQLSLVPVGLSPLREVAPVSASIEWLALLGLGAVLVLALVLWRRTLGVTAGLLWFFGCLVPVANILVPTPHVMADRYLYLPSLGLAAIAGVLAALALGRWRRRAILVGALAALLACEAGLTWSQLESWRSDADLWERVVASQPGSARAHAQLGLALREAAERQVAAGDKAGGRASIDRALAELRRAVDLPQPDGGDPLVAARLSLASILIGHGLEELRNGDVKGELAMEAMVVLRPILDLGGRRRAELAAAMRDVPGYLEARNFLSTIYQSWPRHRPALEGLVAREESPQVAVWQAMTADGEVVWTACLAVLQSEGDIAYELSGRLDAEQLVREVPGYLHARRAAAVLFLQDPTTAPALIAALAREGREFPEALRPALRAAESLKAAGKWNEARDRLDRLCVAALPFPEPYAALADLLERARDSQTAARYAAAAEQLIEARRR